MKFRKVTTLITLTVLFVLVLISLDFLTLTDKWRFFGWEIFDKNYSNISYIIQKSGTKSGPVTSSAISGQGLFPNSPYVFTMAT